jgi:hypothetical protein
MVLADEWIEGIQKSVGYRREALEFLGRAREQFPASTPAHAGTVACLWLAADGMDGPCYDALERLNQGMLRGASEVEITRGASMQPVAQMDPLQDPDFPAIGMESALPPMERLIYECAWSLLWDEGRRGLSVRLTADPQSGELRVLAQGRSYPEHREIDYPLVENRLMEALAELFVAEATAEEEREEMDRMVAEYQERERELQKAAEAEQLPREEPPA